MLNWLAIVIDKRNSDYSNARPRVSTISSALLRERADRLELRIKLRRRIVVVEREVVGIEADLLRF